jgi:hypothetical protein
LCELRRRHKDILAVLTENGGRGVDLAERIDALAIEIDLREHPMKLKEALQEVLDLAEQHVEGVDMNYSPLEGEDKARAIEAVNKVRKHLKIKGEMK